MWGMGDVNQTPKKKKIKKKVEKKNSRLEKPALLSTRLNTIKGITKYEGENKIFKQQLLKKSYELF